MSQQSSRSYSNIIHRGISSMIYLRSQPLRARRSIFARFPNWRHNHIILSSSLTLWRLVYTKATISSSSLNLATRIVVLLRSFRIHDLQVVFKRLACPMYIRHYIPTKCIRGWYKMFNNRELLVDTHCISSLTPIEFLHSRSGCGSLVDGSALLSDERHLLTQGIWHHQNLLWNKRRMKSVLDYPSGMAGAIFFGDPIQKTLTLNYNRAGLFDTFAPHKYIHTYQSPQDPRTTTCYERSSCAKRLLPSVTEADLRPLSLSLLALSTRHDEAVLYNTRSIQLVYRRLYCAQYIRLAWPGLATFVPSSFDIE